MGANTIISFFWPTHRTGRVVRLRAEGEPPATSSRRKFPTLRPDTRPRFFSRPAGFGQGFPRFRPSVLPGCRPPFSSLPPGFSQGLPLFRPSGLPAYRPSGSPHFRIRARELQTLASCLTGLPGFHVFPNFPAFRHSEVPGFRPSGLPRSQSRLSARPGFRPSVLPGAQFPLSCVPCSGRPWSLSRPPVLPVPNSPLQGSPVPASPSAKERA